MSPELVASLWGVTAALSWGVAAFPARVATAAAGSTRTACYSQGLGAAVLTVFLVATQSWPSLGPVETHAVLIGMVAAAVNTVATLGLYHAYHVGMLAVVSPVAASYGAVTTVLSMLSGERLTVWTIVALAVTVAGVALASIQRSASPGPRFGRGVGGALVAAVCFGIAFWLLGLYVTPVLGTVTPVWLMRSVTPTVLFALAPLGKASVWPPPRARAWPAIIGLEGLNLVAFLATAAGLRTGAVSIATVLGSMFSAVTVLLAWLVLHERLQWFQWLGIALTMLGVAMLSR